MKKNHLVNQKVLKKNHQVNLGSEDKTPVSKANLDQCKGN